MNSDFRQRVFLPIVLPLGVVVGFVGFAFALSRVLLAVPELAATAIAVGIAGYILAVAAIVSSKPRITSRALGVGVAIALIGVVTAGTLAGAAGMRELHHGEEEAGGAEGGGEGGEDGEHPADAFVAVDIEWESAPDTLEAGEVTVTLVNEGQTLHNLAFEGVTNDEPVVEAQPGETADGTVELEPGTYTYYCAVPGHRATMEGEVEVQ